MDTAQLRGHPEVKGFFDHRTFSVQYVVADSNTRGCAIIDPVTFVDVREAQNREMRRALPQVTAGRED